MIIVSIIQRVKQTLFIFLNTIKEIYKIEKLTKKFIMNDFYLNRE